jgi:prevent-host-death family protein
MAINTKFIGVKDFRTNISDYVKRARKTNVRFVVVSHNKPLFEVTPFAEDETLDTLFADILAAQRDVKEGRVYTQEEILAELA